jgi:hypothetical protein
MFSFQGTFVGVVCPLADLSRVPFGKVRITHPTNKVKLDSKIHILWSTPKSIHYIVGGRKNHTISSIFSEILWVVRFDTDCKIRL